MSLLLSTTQGFQQGRRVLCPQLDASFPHTRGKERLGPGKSDRGSWRGRGSGSRASSPPTAVSQLSRLLRDLSFLPGEVWDVNTSKMLV